MNTDTAAGAGSRDAPPSLSFVLKAAAPLIALRLALYVLAAPQYGYFRDELYYLACGEHPAWGYVDQPPLIAWIAWLLQHSLGTSLWALRLLPALAHAATIVLAGLLARELGGRRWAVPLAGLAVLAAPVLLTMSQLFTMNAFDPLLWTAIAWLAVRVSKGGDERLWLAAGALAGLEILSKYGILFWLPGLVLGLCLTPQRRSLARPWFWLGAALAAAIALPNFLWQWHHGFPFLQLMQNVRNSGRDIALAPLAFLAAQAQMLGYVTAVLVPAALLLLFSERGRPGRMLAWAYLWFLLLLLILRAKMYYLMPVYPMLFAAGAVWVEQLRVRAALPVLAALTAASGIVLAPLSLPLLSVPQFLAYERLTGLQQQKFEHQPEGVLPQLYADMFGWEELTQRVARYYNSLPAEERRRTVIFANNYGEGGAIDFFGPRYGLPKAIGGHQNYWIWGPRDSTGDSVIVLGDGDERNMQTKCASYSIIGDTRTPLSRPDEWLPIYHCRGLKLDLRNDWSKLKRWN